ncbi:drug/metabolite transporter (DMT)-like permease [Arcicella aurantiaca]|uniref:Drug/metabolite transporter (DMT)-like permease n=1 Tax=Arcicella aurantiaca TaxID=591202 RepID=A0A316E8E7_9BACT|nr:drug/metabolite transporter (DMT)-like permease [Arcicella aurantiaca]
MSKFTINLRIDYSLHLKTYHYLNSDIPQTPIKAYAFLLLGVFCIGWSAIFVKMADAPALTSGFYRYFFCFLGLFPIWLYKKIKIPNTKTLLLIFLGALFFVLDMSLWNLSILKTTASVSTLLANNASVFVGLGSLFIFKQRLSKIYWIGLFVATFGVFLVAGRDFVENPNVGIGHLMAIGAAVFYAGYMLLTQQVRGSIDTVNFMGWSLLICMILAWLICWQQDLPMLHFSHKTWLSFALSGLFCHLIGWLSINYALGFLPASIVSPTLLIQPVLTSIISFFLLHEILRTEQIIGGIVVLFGVYLVNRGK